MTETSFMPETGDADITAYENIDLSQLNTPRDEVPLTEKRLENILIRVVFFSRIATYITLGVLVLASLYGWTRNQKQDSILMGMSINTTGSLSCSWMNHGYDTELRKDTVFRDFLIIKGKQSYLDLLDNGHCIAPDTLSDWLELQKVFGSEEL